MKATAITPQSIAARILRAAGLCRCRAKVLETNPKTGLPFSRCAECREVEKLSGTRYLLRSRIRGRPKRELADMGTL